MKILITGIILFASFQLKTDNLAVVVYPERNNILILGLENPVQALIEKNSKESVVLTAKNSIITKNEDDRFSIRPMEIGILTVNVCKVVRKDTIVIGTSEFRVRSLPDPEPFIGGRMGGRIDKKVLLAQSGVMARLTDSDFNFPIQIEEYSMIAIKDGNIIGSSRNEGPRFNKKTTSLVEQLQPKDKIIIYNIIIRWPGTTKQIRPMEFVIE